MKVMFVNYSHIWSDMALGSRITSNSPHCKLKTVLGLGVSQYTGISVYCNTEQNYSVSRYKSYIPVYCVNTFSRCLLVFHKT
jgi:hypothetical protein